MPRRSIKMVGTDEAECSKCKAVKPIGEFLLNRHNTKYPYRLTYCNRCRFDQVNRSLRKTIKVFLRDRFNRLKRRCASSGVECLIDHDHLVWLYEKQAGKCFYTDEPMEWKESAGLRRKALSIDKIIPELGYIPGNIVLCPMRANTAKSDFSMEEVEKWMPEWANRIRVFQKEF